MSTSNDQTEIVRVTEAESVSLIYAFMGGDGVEFSFGPGWVGLKWDKSKPLTAPLERLFMMRGILNMHTDGAGI